MKKSGISYVDTDLDVPYYSQYIDVKGIEHQHRACGMACVYMTLKYFGADVAPLDDLIQEGMSDGGYSTSGWRHDYFVDLFHRYGYPCERRENMAEREAREFPEILGARNPILVSTEMNLWDKRIFHVVLLTGMRERSDGHLEGFKYHNPASLYPAEGKFGYVSLSLFPRHWRRMAIFPRRS